MSEAEKTYCRLCAEETNEEQLIMTDEDVAISSKIVTKMLWINIDIIASNALPKSICYSCFDSLERTWAFLHNVRMAQDKLNDIFYPKNGDKNGDSSADIKPEETEDAGKPVDSNWEDFETKKEVKPDPENLEIIDPNAILAAGVKIEKVSDNEFDNIYGSEGFNTTDSDLPLRPRNKRKKMKKTKRIINKYDPEITAAELLQEGIVDMTSLSWEDYMCRCAQCDALCKNIASLRLHSLQIHSSCCIFKCLDCGKVIANYKTFITHVRVHKKLLRFFCEYCNKYYKNLKKHLNNAHCDIYATTCQNCGANFESEELLQDHLVIYSKSYNKKRRLKQETDLKCKHCDKEFKSRSNLQQHQLVHTERSRDFSCHVCGKMFFTKGTLSTHMGTHEDAKPFKCEFCPMAFRARGNLASHASLHSGSKPFVCEQCGKSFRVKRHLKSHSIVHTDLMPYICEYCNKPFRFKTRLNLHLRQHTGAKPYTCVYCQRDFTNGSNFKKHMRRRHNVDTSKKRYNNVVNNDSVDSDVNSLSVTSQT